MYIGSFHVNCAHGESGNDYGIFTSKEELRKEYIHEKKKYLAYTDDDFVVDKCYFKGNIVPNKKFRFKHNDFILVKPNMQYRDYDISFTKRDGPNAKYEYHKEGDWLLIDLNASTETMVKSLFIRKNRFECENANTLFDYDEFEELHPDANIN